MSATNHLKKDGRMICRVTLCQVHRRHFRRHGAHNSKRPVEAKNVGFLGWKASDLGWSMMKYDDVLGSTQFCCCHTPYIQHTEQIASPRNGFTARVDHWLFGKAPLLLAKARKARKCITVYMNHSYHKKKALIEESKLISANYIIKYYKDIYIYIQYTIVYL